MEISSISFPELGNTLIHTSYDIGLDKQEKNQRKIVNVFFPISFNICFGRFFLSTHNIYFG